MMAMNSPDVVLSCNNLGAGYSIKAGYVKAVDGVSFEIRRGEFIGIAGESGCGKSTLAYAIMRLLKDNAGISDGEIIFKGKNITRISGEKMRSIRWADISMVFQSAMNALNPVMTVGEQLLDAMLAHKHVSRKEARKRALEMLRLVDISQERFDAFPHQLSGGMRQRVIIAMALLLQPELVIMDEPTTALDVVVQRTIIEKVQELKDVFGFSVIFITHDLSLLVEITNRLAIMYAGRFVEFGPAEAIFLEPLHPYTRGLMSSFPSLTGPITRKGGIEGKPPDLLNPPKGCRFGPRCSDRVDRCISTYPDYIEARPGHYVACHLQEGVRNEK